MKAYSTDELLSLAFSGDRFDPTMPNYQYIFLSFWRNSESRHNEVYITLFETILMAVLGTLFSEALENVDKNQIEGVRATGANQLQRYRFGVIPQILPVFISQTIYYLESNTRSAALSVCCWWRP